MDDYGWLWLTTVWAKDMNIVVIDSVGSLHNLKNKSLGGNSAAFIEVLSGTAWSGG